MGQIDFICNIFVRGIFFKTIFEAWSHVKGVYADQYPLFVHSILAGEKNSGDTL